MTPSCGKVRLGVARMTQMFLAPNKNQWTYKFVAAVRDDRYDGRTTQIRAADRWMARTQFNFDQISPGFKTIHGCIYEEVGMWVDEGKRCGWDPPLYLRIRGDTASIDYCVLLPPPDWTPSSRQRSMGLRKGEIKFEGAHAVISHSDVHHYQLSFNQDDTSGCCKENECFECLEMVRLVFHLTLRGTHSQLSGYKVWRSQRNTFDTLPMT
ncbi:hypothetical protein OG21DRAFT_172593 [Imleria badia]|nr:hypothetical protein OG21DRAFT_172593 [Imleria badia]